MIFPYSIFQYLQNLKLLNLNLLKLGMQGLPDGFKLPIQCIEEYVDDLLNNGVFDEQETNTLVAILIADNHFDI